MAKPRRASWAQLNRLNLLGNLNLDPNGQSEPINFEEAFTTLAKAERAGLWTPQQPRQADSHEPRRVER